MEDDACSAGDEFKEANFKVIRILAYGFFLWNKLDSAEFKKGT
jgi:hypothetical protein